MKKYSRYIVLAVLAFVVISMYRRGEIKLNPSTQVISDVSTATTGISGIINGTASEIKDTFDKTTEPKEELERVTLSKVVDGDTLLIIDQNGNNKYVRLIGVDTPESVHPDAEKNTEYGEIASNYTKTLLSGTNTLFLQYDVEKEDQYGRTLAYVWLTPGADITSKQDISSFMLNGILVRNGYALDKTFPPNIRYADIFAELCQEAEAMRSGFWLIDGFTKSGT